MLLIGLFVTVLASSAARPDAHAVPCPPDGSTYEFVVDDVGLLPADVARVREAIGERVVHLTSATQSGSVLDTIERRVTALALRAGRKDLIVFSAGIVVKAAPSPGAVRLPDGALLARLRRLSRAATAAGVALSFVNVPRADPWVLVRHDLLDSPYDRAAEGPGYLAERTGGVFAKNPGDLALVTARLVADGRSPYILGPAESPSPADSVARPCPAAARTAPP